MDRAVVERKLESLRRCLMRVRDRCPATAAELAMDPDRQDIVSINLTRAVQISVDIGAHILATSVGAAPETMGQTFDLLAAEGLLRPELAARLKSAVGFRNVAIHSYENIDWAIVFAIATHHIADFDQFAAAIAARLSGTPDRP